MKAFEKIKAGLEEAITMTKVMKENEALRADNEKLRAALKPFANEAQFISPHAEDTWFYHDNIRFADLRAAAAAIRETDND